MAIDNTERHDLIDAAAEVGAEADKVLGYLTLHYPLGDSAAAIHARILVSKAQALLDRIAAEAAD